MWQYPSRCFVASNKSGSLFVLDDAGKTDDGVTPATDVSHTRPKQKACLFFL